MLLYTLHTNVPPEKFSTKFPQNKFLKFSNKHDYLLTKK